MSDNLGKVVIMTNITEDDFTHAYGGQPFTVKAKETITFPWDVGTHLAKHLARKILVSKDTGATQFDPKDPSSNGGNGTVLFGEEDEKTLIAKILGESFTVEGEKEKTENEKLMAKIEELNKWRESIEEKEAVEDKAEETDELSALSRKELLAKAKEMEIKYSPTEKSEVIREKIRSAK